MQNPKVRNFNVRGGQFFPPFLGVITTLTLKMNIELSSSTNIVDNLENIFGKFNLQNDFVPHISYELVE